MEIVMRRFLLAVVCVSVSACGVNLYEKKSAPPRPLTERFLRGDVYSLDLQAMLALETFDNRPLIVMFADDTCQPCGKEADEVRELLDLGDTLVKSENLLTVMTGTYVEDAEIWKETHRVEWPVVVDKTREVFKTYCELDQTPCTVIQRPGEGIVFSKIGLQHVRDLVKIAFPE